ncbi:response regulator transcription factor [Mucilaginibacter pallidiroseus]|uniref:Response regulator transcription factor n=1 Tax=Mucilaginibacter pallidiroseus TaxID=2599295 RepID=A0A563UJD8_9SPHI|nr:response regulator transcription factor [Mucilaginibacter pallidiroseus]TWR31461.1 response regulator transcription factor [Mucilaginibacter pallidiroseus]
MSTTLLMRNRSLIIYGFSLALLMVLLKWLEWKFIITDHAVELYAGLIAAVFLGVGVWLTKKLSKPKQQTVYVDREIVVRPTDDFVFNDAEFSRLGLSRREVEVLQLIASGASNQQIADELYVSVNTVKTHTSRLFEKLNVKRRTQAVDMGKKLSIIP